MGSMAQSMARAYLESKDDLKTTHETAWPKFRAVIVAMHEEQLIYATPHDDDLFLLLR